MTSPGFASPLASLGSSLLPVIYTGLQSMFLCINRKGNLIGTLIYTLRTIHYYATRNPNDSPKKKEDDEYVVWTLLKSITGVLLTINFLLFWAVPIAVQGLYIVQVNLLLVRYCVEGCSSLPLAPDLRVYGQIASAQRFCG